MKKKQNDFETSGIERMTDAELSKKLGHYQRTESIGILLGVIAGDRRVYFDVYTA